MDCAVKVYRIVRKEPATGEWKPVTKPDALTPRFYSTKAYATSAMKNLVWRYRRDVAEYKVQSAEVVWEFEN